MNNISFSEWYARFQVLIGLWKELSSDQNWIEAHKDELEQHGLKPDELRNSIQKDIDMLTHQILHFDKEKE